MIIIAIIIAVLSIFLFIMCSMWWLTHLIVAIVAAFATHLILNNDDKSPIAGIPSRLIPLVIVGVVAAAYLLSKLLGWLFTLLSFISFGQCSNWWFETHLAVAILAALATYVFLRRNEEGTIAHACARHTKTAALFCANYLKTTFAKFDARKCVKQISSTASCGLKHFKDKTLTITRHFKPLIDKLNNWRNKHKK